MYNGVYIAGSDYTTIGNQLVAVDGLTEGNF